MVVSQLVEQSLLTLDARGLNLVINKLLYGTFAYCQLYIKDENKEKVEDNGPFKKQLMR